MSVLPLSIVTAAAKPEITNINARSEPSQIKIDFNMPLSPWSAIATGNYYISDGVRALDVRLSTDRKAVLLDTTPLNENGTYKLLTFNLSGDSESDTTPPLFSIQSTDDPSVLNVVFNQPVSPDSAQNINNYFITKDIEIVSATLSDDYLTVALQVTPALAPDITHTLVVENVSRLRVATTEPTAQPDNTENIVDLNNPLPVITLMADNALIEYNGMAQISWEVENATSCVGSGAWSGYKPTSGTRNIGPLKGNSVFFLTCRGSNGSSTKFITVSVLAAEQPTLTFSSNKTSVPKNTRPVISWAVEDATDCTASGDWSGEKPPQGSEQLGLLTEDITLFLTCRGAGGSTMQSLDITMANPPTILFRTSRSTIGYLGVPTLNWYVTDAESCQGTGTDTGESPVTCGGLESPHNPNYYNTREWEQASLPTQGTLSVGPLCVDTTFFLTCTGPGGTTTDFVNIKVLESQPDIRLNANRAYAKPGEKITLTWETLRVNSCTASGGWSGTKTAFPSNSETVAAITQDTVFTLTCQDNRGRSAERSVKVKVKTETPSVVTSPDNTTSATPDIPVTNTDVATPAPVNNQPSRNVTVEEKPVPVREHTFETNPLPLSDTQGQDSSTASEWQIASDKAFTQLVLERTITGQDKLVVPTGLLNRDTDYWIRTRQQNSDGQWSEWSITEPFTTEKYDANDLDSDGTNDQFQMVGFIDTNNNGTDDKEEGICNIYDAFKKTIVGIQSSQGVLRCLNVLSEDELVTAIKSDGQINSMPYGLFNFRVEQLPANTAPTKINIIFYFEKPLPADSQWYQYDKSTDTLNAYTGSVNAEGNQVTIQVIDGGPGDSDGVKNGIIVNPSGPIISTNKALTKPVLAQKATPISEKYGAGSSGIGLLVLLLLVLVSRKPRTYYL